MIRHRTNFVLLLALSALMLTLSATGCATGRAEAGDGDDGTTNAAGQGSSGANARTWEKTLDRVVKGVVQLRVTVPRDFDTDTAGSYGGTGFIVDAERGLILTNRHLVQPGPVVAEAVFLNHEEVPLHAIYRDPVHDFGLFQFDPSLVRFNELEEIELAPAAARVGIDIRVVGNDAGEKLSILPGVLARLDRDAPIYDSVGFNDFNTFYYQAASGTSGGSSGSPVFDIEGRAVALNAGGAFLAESSFFLPLDRVVRAVDLIRQGQPVTRGTLQTIFLHKPYDELRRLGLPLEVETRTRELNPQGVGMLTVNEVVPGGPGADAGLQPGDVLASLGGKPITNFVALEDLLDASVGQTLEAEILRAGEPMALSLAVDDLHAISPSEYIEVGDAIIHPLSYQQARNFRQPVDGLYVARAGYMFGSAGMSWGALIDTIDGQEVRTLDELWTVLTTRKDRERLQIRYRLPFDADQDRVAVVHLDRRWFPLQRCVRNEIGEWPCSQADSPDESWTPAAGSVDIPADDKGLEGKLARSLVMVEYDIPHYVEGVFATHYVGTGLVVDTERGLVVTDRDTVPVALGDLHITIGGSLRVPAQVEYLHPTHNFAVISYDPALIGDTPLEAARFDTKSLTTGEETWLVGLDESYNLVSSESKVDKVAPLVLAYPDFPAFRDSNLEAISIGTTARTLGGVLANEDGAVRALWVSYGIDFNGPLFKGLPAGLVTQVIEPLARGEEVNYRTLGVELGTMNPADARDYGLSDERLAALLGASSGRRQVLDVERTWSGFPSAQLLRGGDILLSVNGKPVATFAEVEAATQGTDKVTLEVLRSGEELSIEVPTTVLPGKGIEHVASWGGMLLHDEHLAIAAQRSVDLDGVYIAWVYQGSPSSHYGLPVAQRIVEVNGQAVRTLDEFLGAVSNLEDGAAVRLLVVDFEGLEQMYTLENDPTFWPSWDLRYDGKIWKRNDR